MRASIPACLFMGVVMAAGSLGDVRGAERKAGMDPVQTRAIYAETMKELDQGGDFLAYLNTDGVCRNLMDFAREMVASMAAKQPEAAMANEKLAKLDAFLAKNGLYRMRALGMSSAPRADGRFDFKTFLNCAPGSRQTPLWQLGGGEPRMLQSMAFLPRDTALFGAGNVDLKLLWQMIRNGLTEIGGSNMTAQVDAMLAMTKMTAGVDVEKTILALGDEMFFAIQLSKERSIMLPMGTNNVPLPEPALLIGLALRDGVLAEIMQSKTNLPFVVKVIGGDKCYSMPVPVPLPVRIEPALVQHKGFLLLASNPDVLEQAVKARDTQLGLAATPEFKQAFAGFPQLINGMYYDDGRFIVAMQKVQRMQIQAQDNPALQEFMTRWQERFAAAGGAGVRINKPNGNLQLAVTPHSGRVMAMSMAIAPVAVMAAVAIPAFVKARATAQQNQNKAMQMRRQQRMAQPADEPGSPDEPAFQPAPQSAPQAAPKPMKRRPVRPPAPAPQPAPAQ